MPETWTQETAETYHALDRAMVGAQGTLALMTRTGSRAYGTDHAESDHDFRAVYVADNARFWSMQGAKQSIDLSEPHDVVAYELLHFCQLAAKANPTALEILWGDDYVMGPSDPDYPVGVLGAGEMLRHWRGKFLSKRIAKTYGGYAMSQVKKAEAGTGGSRGAEHHKRTKFKLHTIRLLDAGIHALREGEVLVRLPNGPELREAVEGIDFVEFRRMAQGRFDMLNGLALTSKLPEQPDEAFINNIIYSIRKGR